MKLETFVEMSNEKCFDLYHKDSNESTNSVYVKGKIDEMIGYMLLDNFKVDEIERKVRDYLESFIPIDESNQNEVEMIMKEWGFEIKDE